MYVKLQIMKHFRHHLSNPNWFYNSKQFNHSRPVSAPKKTKTLDDRKSSFTDDVKNLNFFTRPWSYPIICTYVIQPKISSPLFRCTSINSGEFTRELEAIWSCATADWVQAGCWAILLLVAERSLQNMQINFLNLMFECVLCYTERIKRNGPQ